MIERRIVLVEKQNLEGVVKLIAECNDYDINNNIIKQLSRSPFEFPDTMTDEEIINNLQVGSYSIYFSS